jgi:DNA-binding transcriptional regulator YiaG
MTAKVLRQTLKRLGMSQMALARTLKVQGSTVRRWISGRSPIPEAVALLLSEWVEKHRGGAVAVSRALEAR